MNQEETDRLLSTLDRIAKANEDLIGLANEERTVGEIGGPPFCPHCNTFAPDVVAKQAEGNLADYVLVATCQGCQKTIFGIPQSWTMCKSIDDAKIELARREDS